ncbi:glycosyltransferase family 4 protein [Magnetococcus sp. PR-3]|uniref:glycosyltransferase family 4 protein n=1 Tax=Magnetococcus sp. PR-3 TaxID=3120355 RepID=UPI002FCDF20C
MITRHQIDLVLALSQQVPLQVWDQKGMLDRELALYRTMQPHLRSITLLTDGDRHEGRYQPQLAGMHLQYNRWELRPWHYQRWLKMPWRRWKQGHVLFKSNQLSSAPNAIDLARYYGQKSITRCGYLLSEFAALHHGPYSKARLRAIIREQRAFHGANRAFVTTPQMAQLLTNRYGLSSEQIRIQPNYVDCTQFTPTTEVRKPGPLRLLFVGRLHPEKNLLNLLQAMVGLNDLHLDLIGQGDQQAELEQFIEHHQLSVTLHGRVAHNDLVLFHHNSDLFVLPSLQEGHPKALLEAMACGSPILTTDAPGNRDVVQHGHTGWISATDAPALQQSLKHLQSHPELRHQLGVQARQYAETEVSLTAIAQRELTLYEEIFNTP